MLQPKLTGTNEENLRRLSQIMDVSASAIVNYLVNTGAALVEEQILKMNDDFKQSFKESLKLAVRNKNLTTKF